MAGGTHTPADLTCSWRQLALKGWLKRLSYTTSRPTANYMPGLLKDACNSRDAPFPNQYCLKREQAGLQKLLRQVLLFHEETIQAYRE